MLSRIPSPICLGSVSPSPYKVARHKSPTEPRTAPNNLRAASETRRPLPLDSADLLCRGITAEGALGSRKGHVVLSLFKPRRKRDSTTWVESYSGIMGFVE
jgi:hypothetical protein